MGKAGKDSKGALEQGEKTNATASMLKSRGKKHPNAADEVEDVKERNKKKSGKTMAGRRPFCTAKVTVRERMFVNRGGCGWS